MQRLGRFAIPALVSLVSVCVTLAVPFACARRPNVHNGDGGGSTQVLAKPAYAQLGNQMASVPDVAERATPAVVSVASTRVAKMQAPELPLDHPFFRHFFGPEGPLPFPSPPGEGRIQHGLGSGVIVGKDIILTNAHVVADADELEITTADRKELKAELLGADPKSDLAVLRIKGEVKDLKWLEFADSSTIRLGQVVLAIGNPFGVGHAVTMGIVSAKGRANLGIVDYEDFIQTDAAINPGNSGGALVDLQGRLVGIPTAILSRSGGYMGIGFAIPTNMAKPIMESLLKHGRVTRGWLGVAIQDIDAELARALGLPNNEGVLISDVSPDGPAAKAGLRRGDVVLSVAGQRVNSTGHLRNAVAASGVGKSVDLEVIRRGGKKETLKVKLGEMPSEPGIAGGRTVQPGQPSPAPNGLAVLPLDETTRKRFQIPASLQRGVLVIAVDPGSAAARAGIRPGDVILEVAKQEIDSPARLAEAWAKTKGPTAVLLFREGRTFYAVVQR